MYGVAATALWLPAMEQRDDAPSPSSTAGSIDESGANSHAQSGFDGNGGKAPDLVRHQSDEADRG